MRDALRHRAELREQLQWSRAAWDVEREIDDIVGGGRTIVVGPWLSEVGFETLYWVPFLRWVKAAFRLDPARVMAVSRGGVASWYDGIAGRYVEIWDEVDPAEFARRTAERGATKQLEVSAFDRDVIAAVERAPRRARRRAAPVADVSAVLALLVGAAAAQFSRRAHALRADRAPAIHRCRASAARVRRGQVLRGPVAARHAGHPAHARVVRRQPGRAHPRRAARHGTRARRARRLRVRPIGPRRSARSRG